MELQQKTNLENGGKFVFCFCSESVNSVECVNPDFANVRPQVSASRPQPCWCMLQPLNNEALPLPQVKKKITFYSIIFCCTKIYRHVTIVGKEF